MTVFKRFIFLTLLLGLLIGVVVAIPVYKALGTSPSEVEQKKFEQSTHYDSQHHIFLNRRAEIFNKMDKRPKFKGMGIIKFLFGNDNHQRPDKGLPVIKPDLKSFKQTSDQIKVIWFGHSTFLLNLKGKMILIDPILSNYSSPIPFLIKRFQPPPLDLKEMPHIDTVVISHDHYDHLDRETILSFLGKDTRFMVPLGVGAHLVGWGIERNRISEFDWWDTKKVGEFEFISTPAQHFSGRSFKNRNKTLWGGWVIKYDDKSIFYSGDSGYDIHFKQVGEKYGPFDVAFIENGQYHKAWKEIHLLPEEGVQAFYDLKAKVFFPVHWGAFKLSVHPWYEPIRKVYSFSVEKKFPLVAPKIGTIVEIGESYVQKPWWEELITN